MSHIIKNEKPNHNELPRHNIVDNHSPEQRVEEHAPTTPKSLADFKVNPSFNWENEKAALNEMKNNAAGKGVDEAIAAKFFEADYGLTEEEQFESIRAYFGVKPSEVDKKHYPYVTNDYIKFKAIIEYKKKVYERLKTHFKTDKLVVDQGLVRTCAREVDLILNKAKNKHMECIHLERQKSSVIRELEVTKTKLEDIETKLQKNVRWLKTASQSLTKRDEYSHFKGLWEKGDDTYSAKDGHQYYIKDKLNSLIEERESETWTKEMASEALEHRIDLFKETILDLKGEKESIAPRLNQIMNKLDGITVELKNLETERNELLEIKEFSGIGEAIQLLKITLQDQFVTPKGTIVTLEGKNISRLPTNLQDLKFLKMLNVENSCLLTLPLWINQFSGLESIFLEGNPLEALPETFKELKNLKSTTISSDALTKDAVIDHFPQFFMMKELQIDGELFRNNFQYLYLNKLLSKKKFIQAVIAENCSDIFLKGGYFLRKELRASVSKVKQSHLSDEERLNEFTLYLKQLMSPEHYEMFKSDGQVMNQDVSENEAFWKDNFYFSDFIRAWTLAIKEQTEHDFSDFVRSHLTPKSSVIIKLTEDQIFSQRYFTGTIPNQPKADAPIIPPEAYNNFITKYAGFINASLRLAKGLTVNQRQLFEAVIWELSKSGVAVNDDNFLHQKNALLHLIKEDPEASVDDLMNHFEGGNNSFKK